MARLTTSLPHIRASPDSLCQRQQVCACQERRARHKFDDGTKCEVLLDEAGHARKANPDEELLSRALSLQRSLSRQVTVVTGDMRIQLRGAALGLAEAVMPEKYVKDAQRPK